jgi:hypothetical protein
LHVAGASGTTLVERVWLAGAELDAGVATAQLPGAKREDLSVLGWRTALSVYRPFLAHSELEAMFGKPSELHDRLSTVLGLEDLTATAARLAERRKRFSAEVKAAADERKRLLSELALLDDERAARCGGLLAGREPDLDAVERVVTGAAEVDEEGALARLRSLAQLGAPPVERAASAAEALRTAADALDAAAGTDADRARLLADLLSAALGHRARHPETSECPVCGRVGALDDEWEVATSQQVERLRKDAESAEDARLAADAAVRSARAALTPAPSVVSAPGGPDPIVDVSELHSTWDRWMEECADAESDLRALAEHLVAGAERLATVVSDVVAAAASELQRREDRWTPIARQVAAWLKSGQRARQLEPLVKELKAAEEWLRDAHDDLRNARLRPIAEEAQAVWRELRHESNVDLGAIRLTGSNTRRQVELDVSVDGTAGSALGVMSQGEINALALSVFLPRATMGASPFRFVVIDDPVQAMDPAKVDGLARVLDEYARSRQVIVFTHDDRLPAAIRRLGIAARVLQVLRRPGSLVEITNAGDPATQALRDARAVANDENVPAGVAARVVPGLCRIAVEAALTDAARRRLLAGGDAHDEVETALEDALRLTHRAALALFGDVSRAGDVLGRLDSMRRQYADTFRALNRGAHGELVGTPIDTVSDTELLVAGINSACP